MKRTIILLLSLLVVLALPAQSRKEKSSGKANVTAKSTKGKSSRKTTATVQKSRQGSKSTATTKSSRKTTSARSKQKSYKSSVSYSNSSIKGLQKQRSQLQANIKKQEKALKANQADVKKRLQDLLVINSQIDEHKKSIDGIEKDIHHIDGNIGILNTQLKTLQQQLDERKALYVKSMRYMARHHKVQDQLLFIFSAKDFAQMYRRLRFVKEYAAYQRAQGEMVKLKQGQVTDKHRQLQVVKGQKSSLLYKGKKEQSALEGKQTEQQQVVTSLQRQQKTIEKVLAQQRQKSAALNAQIDRMIAEEVAKARARAAEEARKRAAAAAEAKARQEALERKRAQAAAEARENERRIAAARALEAKRKAEAQAAAERRDEAAKARADQQAREAEAARVAAERKAEVEAERNRKAIADARKDAQEAQTLSSADRMMSGGFAANKGRLPMPITGSYRVVTHFGQYDVSGLKGVRLDNKGINILGSPGCQARAVYDGVVSRVFSFGGTTVVMVRHGSYISVYCNLRSVSVSTGQHVSTRQALGTVGADNILQFQLHHETTTLNPESWLGR